MKKFVAVLTTSLVLLSGTSVFAGAKVSNQDLIFDGVKQEIKGYNIGDNNYFKLRDIAALLDGTKAEFGVDYDEERRAVKIERGGDYTKKEDDLKLLSDSLTDPIKSNHRVLVDDYEVNFTSYTIDGYNYFKLRELGRVIGFYVDFDEDSGSVILKSEKLDPKPIVNNQITLQITSYATSYNDTHYKTSEKPTLTIDDFFKNINSNVLGATNGQASAKQEYIKADGVVLVTPNIPKYVGKFSYTPKIRITQGENVKVIDYDGEIDISKVLSDNGFEPNNKFEISLGSLNTDNSFNNYSSFVYN
ncbi:hypothetical protein [Peptoniphilus sp.]|jgi:hypothetical protein|uniref:hypothetical protein n=1 Tax=Peptoniphilus sp. TaxID=1971214 RepID=UPI003D89CAD4